MRAEHDSEAFDMSRVKATDSSKSFLTRREVLAAVPVGLIAGGALADVAGSGTRPRIAAVVTEYRLKSHGQGIVDRFLDGYGWEGRHYRPGVEIVSLYVDQKPKGDLSAERVKRHPGLKLYPTIAEALTRGTTRLDVDGVLLIAEHGRYPRNEKGQTLYPRYEFFEQVVDVFRRTGRAAPVFVDKHLSWNARWARSMVETARKMSFPLMAGSSLPVTRRLPAVDLPSGAEVVEAVSVAYGGVDSYDFHGLEAIQCLVERRRGGETGVATVQALRGESVWKALHGGSWKARGCDLELFETCLCRSFTLTSPRPGYGNVFPSLDQLPGLVRDPVLYRVEYTDGLKTTLLMLNGLVRDFTVAVRLGGEAKPLSTQMYLPGLSPGQTLPDFFSPLAHHVETMFLTGKAAYPVERTLLTTSVLATAIESLNQGRKLIETPDIRALRYQVAPESTYWQT
jgi:hypothetical protein